MSMRHPGSGSYEPGRCPPEKKKHTHICKHTCKQGRWVRYTRPKLEKHTHTHKHTTNDGNSNTQREEGGESNAYRLASELLDSLLAAHTAPVPAT